MIEDDANNGADKNAIEKKLRQIEASVKKVPNSTKVVPIKPKASTLPAQNVPRGMTLKRILPARNYSNQTLESRVQAARSLPLRTMPPRRVKSVC